MKPIWQSLMWVVVCGFVLGLVPSVWLAAAGGQQPPGPTRPPELLVDITPTALYFNNVCDLMADVKNRGRRSVGGSVHYRYFMNGQLIGSASAHLTLMSGSQASVKIASRPILGVWVEEQKSWRLEMDDDNQLAESNEQNNAITAQLSCTRMFKERQ